MNKQSIETINQICEILSKRIFKLHNDDPNNATFDQCGILEGKSVVQEYLDTGEWGLEIQHSFYMVNESEIEIDANHSTDLKHVALKYGVMNPYQK